MFQVLFLTLTLLVPCYLFFCVHQCFFPLSTFLSVSLKRLINRSICSFGECKNKNWNEICYSREMWTSLSFHYSTIWRNVWRSLVLMFWHFITVNYCREETDYGKANIISFGPENLHLLQNPTFRCLFHKNPPQRHLNLVQFNLVQFNLVHALIS